MPAKIFGTLVKSLPRLGDSLQNRFEIHFVKAMSSALSHILNSSSTGGSSDVSWHQRRGSHVEQGTGL